MSKYEEIQTEKPNPPSSENKPVDKCPPMIVSKPSTTEIQHTVVPIPPVANPEARSDHDALFVMILNLLLLLGMSVERLGLTMRVKSMVKC